MTILVLFLKRYCLVVVYLLLLTPAAMAAIVNNNHLYQKTQQISQQLAVIRAQQNLPALNSEPQIVADKLAIHLVFKTQQLNELAAKLQSQHGVAATPADAIAYAVIRPRSVMPYLESLEQQLASVTRKLQLAKTADIERPLGKSVNDVYQQLVMIEQLFADLLEREANVALARNLTIIKGDLQQISQQKDLPLEFASVNAYQNREVTDANIVAFQCLYLLERLFRQLAIEPSKPGRLPTAESNIYQLVDTTVNLRAELHRAKTLLQIEQDSEAQAQISVTNANQAYAQLEQLRSGLLTMVGAKAL
ncbi:hypothetical protein M0C34_00405 [Agarivorans sp. TSD2052]|uniref:hypothetical protein n=1 Tax=Agarivorans sp. TSD2052 TaxID=2937286 RepID=UPI00200C8394|nr:hypothetical protein [Agarivorans sp. TSD2052]UPW18770.1 hypothetical protein M0C34_00405 [Agarivorans sp. TSD2052]